MFAAFPMGFDNGCIGIDEVKLVSRLVKDLCFFPDFFCINLMEQVEIFGEGTL